MELSTSKTGEVVVVHCEGRLNMVAAPQLTTALQDSIAAQGPEPRVVVDLGGTVFVDSSGLGALVAGLNRARKAGGDLRIAAPSEQVRTVLSLTNLDRVLRPHDTVADASDGW